MLTYSGVHVVRNFGAPSIRDIAVQSMRLCRFGGAGRIFYPVGVHLLLVADLLPLELEHHGLLHDAAEVVVNDIPRPMKTKAQRAVEHRVLRRIYHALGVSLPTPEQAALIHVADIRALNVEGVRMETGPRGFAETQAGIVADPVATKLLDAYVSGWNPLDAINPDGHWPHVLEHRLRIAVTRVHNSASYRNGYTKPA
jgi:hypothetical protein